MRSFRRLWTPATVCSLGWVLAGLATAFGHAAGQFFVDPLGRDSWTGARATVTPGKADGPLRTVEVALIQAREWRRTHPTQRPTITLLAGRHELPDTLELGPDDSGLTLEGARGPVPPTLSGGTLIRGWRPTRTNREVWEVVLPEVAEGKWYFHQLFVRDQRAQRARTPNTGFFHATAPLSTGAPLELPYRAGDLRPEWVGLPDARVVLLEKWTDLHLPLAGLDPTRLRARFPGRPREAWMDEPDARYWVENTPDSLDQPGEWYLDRATGRLKFWAPRGLDPNAVPVVAPRLRELVRWKGSADGSRAASGITLRNLRFADADYAMPAEGLVSPQAAVVVPGTLSARHAVDCALLDCRFENFGGYGLELGRGCQRWRVVGCQFLSLGAGGIRLGEPGDLTPSAFDANHSHRVTDNRLQSLGRVFAPAVGLLVFQSGTNRIAHNHLKDLYYTGISVGWNWGYQDTPCRANEIDHNLVEQVGQERLSDMGGIYTLGPQPGTHIHHNLFRDIRSHGYGGWGLYTDEGSTGILLENNVVYRCKSAGFHQHYGRDNVVRNNLLAFNAEHQVMRTRSEPHRSFWFTNNVVIHAEGSLLGSDWSGGTNQFWMDSNLYWDTRQGTNAAAYRWGRDSWEAWQARGQDRRSRIADPLLVDPLRPEAGFRRGSPALDLGFQQIDLRNVGPRPANARN
jgi:hypothetical protein